ncbi:MAG: MaoC/PaaZ C-terminal domain-containing protein [Actinomycetota bacterium]
MSSSETPLLFDDIRVGTVMSTSEEYEITREEVIEVARRWDPMPIHLDEAAATATEMAGLVASTLHVLFASMHLAAREEPKVAIVAGIGLDDVRALHRVRPGDRLRQTAEVIDLRPSRSRRDRGIVRIRRTVRNQDGVEVLTYSGTWLVERAPSSSLDPS